MALVNPWTKNHNLLGLCDMAMRCPHASVYIHVSVIFEFLPCTHAYMSRMALMVQGDVEDTDRVRVGAISISKITLFLIVTLVNRAYSSDCRHLRTPLYSVAL
jgi:hypothetical protein